jgi:GntR family transcriptional regulator of arabinose operon
MPKYQKVKQWLQEKIADGTFVSGDKILSEHELAAQFGYSRQTVRQAVNELVSEKILSRAQGSGTYVTGATSRTAALRIGVIIAWLDPYNFPSILQGIHEILNACHCTILLGITYNRQIEEENALRQMLTDHVDGLIIESTKSALPNVNKLLYQKIKNQGIPIVFFNSYYRDFKESYVIMDESHAGALAATALLQKGHKKIGAVLASDDLRGLRRYEGIQSILKQQNLSLERRVIWYTTEDLPRLFSENANSVLPAQFFDLSAVICYNDTIATLLFSLFSRHNFRVPQDISMISFSNLPLTDISGGLTSICCPFAEMGKRAANLMLKKISDPSCEECIILKPTLQYRSSIQDLIKTEQI